MKIVAALASLGFAAFASAQSYPVSPSIVPVSSISYPSQLNARAAQPIIVTVKTTVTLGPDGHAFKSMLNASPPSSELPVMPFVLK